jgi:hypothetical protein
MYAVRSGSLAIALTLLLPSAAALAQDASPPPSAQPTLSPAAQEFADAFPAEIGGVALAGRVEITEASAPDQMDPATLPLITDLAADLAIDLDEILVASAMTFDDFFAEEATGVWIMALMAPGMTPEAGVDFMLELWTMEAVEEALVISETQIAEREVTRIASAEDPDAAFNLYGSDGIVWMVAADDPALLEETLSKLP